jgi:hypothetical protein
MAKLSHLLSSQPDLSSTLSEALRVGVHWDTQVGPNDMSVSSNRVCQVFCSALPVSYCPVTENMDDWQLFATLVLTAA